MRPPKDQHEIRTLARLAMKKANNDEDKAYKLFTAWCGEDKPSHAKDVLRRWGYRDNTKNKPGQGRPHKISHATAKKLAKTYKKGFTTCGEQRGFRSVAHAKKKSKKAFANVLKQCHNPTDKTVRKAMKAADPNLGKVRQCPRKELSESNQKLRRKISDTNLRRGIQRLHAVTFMDEFAMTAELSNTMVAGDKRKGDKIIKDRFQVRKFKDRPKIHVLIAVNYAKGPLYHRFLTGTTGGVGKTYKVSCHAGCLLHIGQLREYITNGLPLC